MSSEANRVLAVTGFGDRILQHIAPLGLAAVHLTSLVVDLDTAAAPYPSAPTLLEMLERGLRRSELVPERTGVAVIGNGGIEPTEAWSAIFQFARHWPAVVVRVGEVGDSAVPRVPVIPLLPEPVRPVVTGPAVYQVFGRTDQTPGPGIRLPRLSRRHIESLMTGRVDRRWAWVRSFRPVWELPWR